MQIHKQPYHLLFIGGILIFLFSFFTSEQLIDIHAYDTYYIIPEKLILLGFSVLLFLFWLVYKFTGRFFYSTILINTHILLTTAGLLIIIFFLRQQEVRVKATQQFYNLGNATEAFTKFNSYLLITGLVLVLIQFIFLFNLTVGIFRKGINKDPYRRKRRRKQE